MSNSNSEQLFYIKDHIQVKIDQTAKGARVTVTVDRSDHDIGSAVSQAIQVYESSIKGLEEKSLLVDVH